MSTKTGEEVRLVYLWLCLLGFSYVHFELQCGSGFVGFDFCGWLVWVLCMKKYIWSLLDRKVLEQKGRFLE